MYGQIEKTSSEHQLCVAGTSRCSRWQFERMHMDYHALHMKRRMQLRCENVSVQTGSAVEVVRIKTNLDPGGVWHCALCKASGKPQARAWIRRNVSFCQAGSLNMASWNGRPSNLRWVG